MIFGLQKPGFIKRIFAFLFDLIIFCVVTVGVAVLVSGIVGYDAKLEELEDAYLVYEEKYNIDLDITEEDYNKLTDAEKKVYEEASKAFANDSEVQGLQTFIFSLTLVIVSCAILSAFLILELLVPFFFKNGQTMGKKIFGVAIMRTDGVKVTFFQLFVRAILGKYTIETMVPVLLLMMFFMGSTGFVGLLVPFLILMLEIVVMSVTETNSLIHDLLSVTVAVDINTQLIFESEEKMIEYKKKRAEEAAQKSSY